MPRCPSPSHAIIDLSAIAANLTEVRKRAGDRKVLFAVKADAYGHGAVEISRYVEKHRYADWLAVATVAEGQELVESGITLPILKLSPADPWDTNTAITSGMRLTVVDFDTLDAVSRAAVQLGVTAKVHIAVDSGMGRIGLPPNASLNSRPPLTVLKASKLKASSPTCPSATSRKETSSPTMRSTPS